MKIIISENQQKLLVESKQIESVQRLVGMAIEDYLDGCSKATIYSNLQLALCKGIKKGTTKVKVIDVKLIENTNTVKTEGKIYVVKLSIITDQEWFQRDSFTSFEIRLSDLVSNIIGSYRYWFMVTKVEVDGDEDMITESSTRKEKLKKFLTNKLGIDFISSIKQITSSYDVPMIFDEGIGSVMINRYLNFWGPMYLFELDGDKFLYQDRDEFEWFMDEKGFEFVDDEVIEKLGIGEIGLKFSDIINTFFEEGEDMINENREMDIRLRRRSNELEKIGDIIEYQTEIQDPCDFEDETDYADFCIGQGLSFYYNDEEDEDYEYPSDEMVKLRDEVEDYLQEKYYDYLVSIYNDLVTNCN